MLWVILCSVCWASSKSVFIYMQAKDFLSTQPSHYMYVNGACVYMLCFQYRTDCLQHLPLQVREWCMCLHALLSVQDRLSKSPSHSQFKQEILVFYMCIWDKWHISIPALPLTFDLLVGDQDKLILIYVSICSHLRPGC